MFTTSKSGISSLDDLALTIDLFAGEMLEIISTLQTLVGESDISSRNGCWYQQKINVIDLKRLSTGEIGQCFWQHVYQRCEVVGTPIDNGFREKPKRVKKEKENKNG